MGLQSDFVSNIRKVVALLSQNIPFTDEQIAQESGLPITFVEDIRNQVITTEGLG